MRIKIIKAACLCACFAMVAVPVIYAQGRGPGGGAPPPVGPAGVGGGIVPNGQAGMAGTNSGVSSRSRSATTNGTTSNGQGSGAGNGVGRTPTLLPGPTGRWWDNATVVRQVGITRVQQQKMDNIFDANRASLVADYKTLQQKQAALDAMSKNSNTDQTTLFAAIDGVNQARAALQKVTMQTLLQIRQQMDAKQISKLESIK